MFNKKLYDFLDGKGPDRKGRMFQDILEKDNEWWESNHDFIQWLFPIDLVSDMHPFAPVVKDPSRYHYPLIRSAYHRFMIFLYQSDWKKKNNHNQRRITRVIRSLLLFGEDDLAAALLHYVMRESETDGNLQNARLYWLGAYHNG